jgi:hypothetical protein
LKGRRAALVRAASAAGMFAVLAVGCGGASENAETPEQETVMVTVAKTVEKTAQAAAPTPAVASPPTPAQPPSTAGGTTTPDAADITCEVGQPCDLSGSTVTVTQVQFFRGIQNFGKTLEGYFVVVAFDYTFYEEEPTQTGQPPFWLSDEDGNTYSLDTMSTISYGSQAGRMLTYPVVQPSVPTPSAAVFKVAPEAKGFTLLVKDLFLPDTRKAAKIPLPEASW